MCGVYRKQIYFLLSEQCAGGTVIVGRPLQEQKSCQVPFLSCTPSLNITIPARTKWCQYSLSNLLRACSTPAFSCRNTPQSDSRSGLLPQQSLLILLTLQALPLHSSADLPTPSKPGEEFSLAAADPFPQQTAMDLADTVCLIPLIFLQIYFFQYPLSCNPSKTITNLAMYKQP